MYSYGSCRVMVMRVRMRASAIISMLILFFSDYDDMLTGRQRLLRRLVQERLLHWVTHVRALTVVGGLLIPYWMRVARLLWDRVVWGIPRRLTIRIGLLMNHTWRHLHHLWIVWLRSILDLFVLWNLWLTRSSNSSWLYILLRLLSLQKPLLLLIRIVVVIRYLLLGKCVLIFLELLRIIIFDFCRIVNQILRVGLIHYL